MNMSLRQAQENTRQTISAPQTKGANAEDLLTSTMTLRTQEVLESLGVHTSHENFLSALLQAEEAAAKEAAKEKEELLYQTLDIEKSSKDMPSGEEAVFEAAAFVAKDETAAESQEISDVQADLKRLELEVNHLEKVEAFVNKLVKAIENLNFPELNKLYAENSGLFAEVVSSIINALMYGTPIDWGKIANLKGVHLFGDSIKKVIQGVLKEVESIKKILLFLEEDRGENAIFLMETMMQQLESVALQSNADQSKAQEKESQINIEGLQQRLTKIQNEIKKLQKAKHHHHHGIFGWLEDLVDSIKDIVEKIAHLVADVATGHESEAWNEFKSLIGFDKIKSFFEDLSKGKIEDAFKAFATAMVLMTVCAVLGPIGSIIGSDLLMDTSFGQDMKSAVNLVSDAVIALAQLTVAGLAAYIGEDKEAEKLMASDKKLGIKMLENAALKPLMDIAMVVVIASAAAAQQYWLAGIMAVMLAMSDFGGMEAITKGLTDLFEDMGISAAAAKVLADATVVVAVTLLTLGAGSFESAGETAGDVAAQAGKNVAQRAAAKIKLLLAKLVETLQENLSSEATRLSETAVDEIEMTTFGAASPALEDSTESTLSNAAEKQENIVSRVVKGVGRRVGKRAGAALTGFGMGLGSTSFGVDLAKLIDKKDKELQEILEIVQEVMALVATAVGGAGVAFGGAVESAEGAGSTITKGIRKILPKLAKYMEDNAAELTQLSAQAQRASMVIQGAGQAAEGGLDIVRGDIQAQITEEQGLFEELQNLQEITNAAMTQTNSQRSALIKEFDKINDELIKAPGLVAEAQYQVLSQNIV